LPASPPPCTYSLSLHDALPIYPAHFTCAVLNSQPMGFYQPTSLVRDAARHGVEVRDVCVLQSSWDSTLEAPEPEKDDIRSRAPRSEEHTSELQSREKLVCRLLL